MRTNERFIAFFDAWGYLLLSVGLLLVDRFTVIALSPLALLIIVLMGLRTLHKKHRETLPKRWVRLPWVTTGVLVLFIVLDYFSFFFFSHWWEATWFRLFFVFMLVSNTLVWLLIGLKLMVRKVRDVKTRTQKQSI